MTKWKVLQWLYNGVLYNSTEALRVAWEAGEIKSLGANVKGAWSESDQEGRSGGGAGGLPGAPGDHHRSG